MLHIAYYTYIIPLTYANGVLQQQNFNLDMFSDNRPITSMEDQLKLNQSGNKCCFGNSTLSLLPRFMMSSSLHP